MDRRVEELKYLKKAYRREKRTATALWKWLFVLSLADCVLFAPFAAQAFLPGFPVTYWAELGISFALDFLPNLQGLVSFTGAYPLSSLIFLGIGVIIFLVATLMWIFGSRKLRRTDAFLSYRTLRNALRAEKSAQ